MTFAHVGKTAERRRAEAAGVASPSGRAPGASRRSPCAGSSRCQPLRVGYYPGEGALARGLALSGLCVRRRLDVHQVAKRSQGGSDFDLDQLAALCRWCHNQNQTDAPYERGRLLVSALGAGQFAFEVVQRTRQEASS